MDFMRALQVFVRVAEAGSFVRAADQLDLSNAAVTRQVAALERHLGARLFNRTTRSVSLTVRGEALLEKAQEILGGVAEAEGLFRGGTALTGGVLRLSAPLSFGVAHLSRLLPDFRRRHPALRLDVDLSDRVADLAGEGFDMALRITREPAANLVARRIAPVRLVLCASPGYLKAHGRPRALGELARHRTLGYSYLEGRDEWSFSHEALGAASVRIDPEVRSNNGELLRELALVDGGIILQPTFIVGPDVARGALVPILDEWKARELSLYAVYLSRRQLAPKVRVFIDYLAEAIGEEPYWEARKPAGRRGGRSSR